MMRLSRCVSSSALVVSSVFGLAMLQGGTAEAGRGHFSGSVRVGGRVHAGVSVRFARPAARPFFRPRVWGGSRWWWRGYYYPRTYYYYYSPYYPEYVPSYYGYGATYYPVQPGGAPGEVAVVAPRRSLPTLGVFAGGTNVNGQEDSTDWGAMLRLRLGGGGLLAEGEIGKTTFKDDVRVDRRIGASLIYEIGAHNSFAPYLLAGGGIQQADFNGDFTTTQDFGELGVGLRWALSRNFHLTFDIRAGRRKTIDSNQSDVPTTLRSIAPPSGGVNNDTEDYTRGRLAAVLNF
jgi:hypothetical protein